VTAAVAREETRGAHSRVEFPNAVPDFRLRLVQ
jgi:aspartate oxidase